MSRELIASTHPVLTLSFHNCDIHCCHLDGYGRHSQALLERLEAVEASFSGPSLRRVWYNLDETELPAPVMAQVAQSIVRTSGKMVKVAFVGLGTQRRRFEKCLAAALADAVLPRAYFDDAEQAKEWLI